MTTLPIAPAVTRERAQPTLTVDLTAVAANTGLLAARATGELMAVVKADGFGHGAGRRRPRRARRRRHPARRDQPRRGARRCAPTGSPRRC